MSHPPGVRGLKQHDMTQCCGQRLSHPPGVRGLKQEITRNEYLSLRRTPQGCVD